MEKVTNTFEQSGSMSRPSHKEKILTSGLRVVHERGYTASSVRDIIEAAGVPQGSFTNHFASKEAFGLELVNIYYKDIEHFMAETLLNDALPPLKRLHLWAEGGVDSLNQNGHWNGCLLGNFGAEASAWKSAEPPRIMGQDLQTAPGLGFWFLHVWVWKRSPSGLFLVWNPDVKCGTDAATMNH